ncbi:MAG: conjugal transfer protein TraX [Solobacterium sp.]|nr:conjugal transfer protein TraX [Solobacterium sp.]
MQKIEKYRILDGTALKIIAMISMVLDHVGAVFFPGARWMRYAGRIAMPVFAFCVAEGYAHTRDRRKYIIRMGVFALFSEIPFDLLFFGRPGFEHQNILVTFFLALIALELFERLRGTMNEETGRYGTVRTILGNTAVIAVAALALVLRTDYSMFGVIAVFLFYLSRDMHPLVHSGSGTAFLALTRTMGSYRATGLSFLPLALYNGKRGKGLKWLFYLFYPGHALLLYMIRRMLQG